MDADIDNVINILLCAAIVGVGIVGYWKSRHELPLFVAVAFAFFTVSHFLELLEPSMAIDVVSILFRVVAYALFVFLLLKYVRSWDMF
ncbi:MAG: hypothetical protein LUQ09_00555 [Methanomassiliicoccales archaeon]|nr:hypothetical protein [Methanomassiliicoccales archaeon]